MKLKFALLCCFLLDKLFGYEGINLLLRVMPMSLLPIILKKYGANIGTNVCIKSPLTFNDAEHRNGYFTNLTIGSNTFIGRNCLIDLQDKITIGENVTISHNVSIFTHTDAGNSPLADNILMHSKSSVSIGNGTYIGAGVIILQGNVIGENTIIGASSLVNKNLPSNCLAYGVPISIKESYIN